MHDCCPCRGAVFCCICEIDQVILDLEQAKWRIDELEYEKFVQIVEVEPDDPDS